SPLSWLSSPSSPSSSNRRSNGATVVSLPHRADGTNRTDAPHGRGPVRIDVEELGKSYGGFAALNNVSLSVRPGELLALLGPSGSGKTTLLRAIAGLTSTEEGAIRFDGEDATALSLRDRRVGFVFQQYALFRHMTVFDNVAFGLRVRPQGERPRAGEIARSEERRVGKERRGRQSRHQEQRMLRSV